MSLTVRCRNIARNTHLPLKQKFKGTTDRYTLIEPNFVRLSLFSSIRHQSDFTSFKLTDVNSISQLENHLYKYLLESNENIFTRFLQFLQEIKKCKDAQQMTGCIMDDICYSSSLKERFLSDLKSIDGYLIINNHIEDLLSISDFSIVVRESINQLLLRPEIEPAVTVIKISRWSERQQSLVACGSAMMDIKLPRIVYPLLRLSESVKIGEFLTRFHTHKMSIRDLVGLELSLGLLRLNTVNKSLQQTKVDQLSDTLRRQWDSIHRCTNRRFQGGKEIPVVPVPLGVIKKFWECHCLLSLLNGCPTLELKNIDEYLRIMDWKDLHLVRSRWTQTDTFDCTLFWQLEKKLNQQLIKFSEAADVVSLYRDVIDLTRRRSVKPPFTEYFLTIFNYFKPQSKKPLLHPNVILGLISAGIEFSEYQLISQRNTDRYNKVLSWKHKPSFEKPHVPSISHVAIDYLLNDIEVNIIRFSLNQIVLLISLLEQSRLRAVLPDQSYQDYTPRLNSILSLYLKTTNLKRVGHLTKALLNEELISLCHFVLFLPPESSTLSNEMNVWIDEFINRFDDLKVQSTKNEQMLTVIRNLPVSTIESLSRVILTLEKSTNYESSYTIYWDCLWDQVCSSERPYDVVQIHRLLAIFSAKYVSSTVSLSMSKDLSIFYKNQLSTSDEDLQALKVLNNLSTTNAEAATDILLNFTSIILLSSQLANLNYLGIQSIINILNNTPNLGSKFTEFRIRGDEIPFTFLNHFMDYLSKPCFMQDIPEEGMLDLAALLKKIPASFYFENLMRSFVLRCDSYISNTVFSIAQRTSLLSSLLHCGVYDSQLIIQWLKSSWDEVTMTGQSLTSRAQALLSFVEFAGVAAELGISDEPSRKIILSVLSMLPENCPPRLQIDLLHSAILVRCFDDIEVKNSLEQLLTKLLKISSGNTGVPDASLDRIGMIKLFQVVARLLYHGPSVFRSTLSKPEVRSFIAMGPHNSWIKHTEEQEEMFLGSAFYDYMKNALSSCEFLSRWNFKPLQSEIHFIELASESPPEGFSPTAIVCVAAVDEFRYIVNNDVEAATQDEATNNLARQLPPYRASLMAKLHDLSICGWNVVLVSVEKFIVLGSIDEQVRMITEALKRPLPLEIIR